MGLFFMLFAGALVSAVVSVVRRITVGSSGAGSVPAEELPAVVVSKRMHLTGGEHASTLYYAAFEFEDDRRMELRLSGEAYGSLAEGDVGVLTKRGSRFVSFRRTDDRFDAKGAGEREHKCSACGAPYTGRVCPYCDTPFRS